MMQGKCDVMSAAIYHNPLLQSNAAEEKASQGPQDMTALHLLRLNRYVPLYIHLQSVRVQQVTASEVLSTSWDALKGLDSLSSMPGVVPNYTGSCVSSFLASFKFGAAGMARNINTPLPPEGA